MSNSPQFLTAVEVSQRLRLPLSTVYHLVKTGVLPAIQLGRSWRFLAHDIESMTRTGTFAPRILAADDDRVARTLIVELLSPLGCNVIEASSVNEAWLATQRMQFELLLIDFKMPDGDGTELVRRLLPGYSLSQMVIITAFPDLAQLDKLFDLGALTLLRKPLEPSQLLECVQRIIGHPLTRTPQRTLSKTFHSQTAPASPFRTALNTSKTS